MAVATHAQSLCTTSSFICSNNIKLRYCGSSVEVAAAVGGAWINGRAHWVGCQIALQRGGGGGGGRLGQERERNQPLVHGDCAQHLASFAATI